MAKTFLTNINLKGNQLLNAVIHSASSAPSIYNAGQLYFSTTANNNRGALYQSYWSNYPTTPATYAWEQISSTYNTVSSVNNFTGAVTVAGTSNQVVVSNATNTVTISLASALTLPGSLAVPNGSATTLGGTLTVTGGKSTFTASTTGGASINIPVATSAPTAPVAGDIWLDSTAGFKAYYNSGTHTIADLDSTQTFTNKSLSGSTNTFTNIPNSALVHPSITVTPGTGISVNGGTSTVTTNLGDTLTIANTGVTSVALSLPSIFTVSNSPVTTTGTLTATLNTQAKNTVFAGPATGSDATPTFRSLVDADIPASVARLASPTFTGTVTIPTLSLTNALSVTNGGTGATTAAGARTNLGAAESGANSSITSLSGLTTALSVGQGGTGTSTTPTSGKILIGKADGTYAVATLSQGATNGVTITNGSGSITLDTAQDIRSTATPTFAQVYVSADPSQALQVATKQYVDNLGTGFNSHDAVEAATTAPLGSTYGTVVYTAGTADNGGGYGVGATLTSGINGVFTIDNYTPDQYDRVLIKNETNATWNGIYVVTNTGSSSSKWVLTRAVDSDNHIAGQVAPGDLVFVAVNTSEYVTVPTQNNTGWVMNTQGTGNKQSIVIGTDPINWTQFSGSGTITAGNGILVVGSQVSVSLGSSSDTTSTGPTSNSGLSLYNGTLQLNLNPAGGLSTTNSGLKVNVGTGLAISSNNIILSSDTVSQTATGVSGGARTYGIQKLSATITGNNSASSFDIVHNLSTRDVTVAVYQASASPDTQWAEVEVDITHKDTNTVTIGFASAPSTGILYNVVITG